MGLQSTLNTSQAADLPRFRRERCLRNSGTREKRRNVVATLSVLKFNDLSGADRVLLALQGMQERHLITLQDAAIVSWPEDRKKPKTRQLLSMAGTGATFGALWGFCSGRSSLCPSSAWLSARAWGRWAVPWQTSASTMTSSSRCARGNARDVGAVCADQRGDGRQGDRGAQAVRLRDNLDQPSCRAGAKAARGLRRGDLRRVGGALSHSPEEAGGR